VAARDQRPGLLGERGQRREAAEHSRAEQRLLTLEPTPQQLALRTWYLGEFTRQAAGQAPAPWPGSLTVEADPQ
jgi:hypothetical protein